MGCEAPINDREAIACEIIGYGSSDDIDNSNTEQSRVDDIGNIINNTRSSLESEKTNFEKLQYTTDLIGREEFLFIQDYFWLPHNPQDFVEWVRWIQRQIGFSLSQQDGIIWPYTLKKIYERYYSYNYEKLWNLQKWRLIIYNEIGISYPDWVRPVKEKENENMSTLRVAREKMPDIFNKNYYFWATQWEPIDGWFINSKVQMMVPSVLVDRSWVQWFVRQINGRYVLSVYVNGILSLASYVSPWDTQKYWESASTPEIKKRVLRLENNTLGSLTTKMHYISWGSDSVYDSPNHDGSYNSDPMPFAVWIKIKEWIYAHAWFVDGNPRSHGCIRLPAHYARWLYEIFKIYWEITWDTHIKKPMS